jgi:GxxExxY protein
MEIHELSKKIIGCAFKVHNFLGYGFLEKVYENALAMELREGEGLPVIQQYPAPVFYKDRIIGEYIADLFVGDAIIVEVKSVSRIMVEHESQLVNYLKATGIDHGLLINFGPSVEVKHKYREYKRKIPVHPDQS